MVNKEKVCGILFCAYWEKEGKTFYKKKEEKKTCMCQKLDASEKEKKEKKREKNKSGMIYIVYVGVAQSFGCN